MDIHTCLQGIFIDILEKKKQFISLNFFQVDDQSTAYGGELVADVLKVDKYLRSIRFVTVIEFILFLGSWNSLSILFIRWSYITNISRL